MKFIDEVKLEGQKVILRCDYNVPMDGKKISDDTRIVKSLKTINYLLECNCSLIIMSHLGRIKTAEDKKENSLAPVAKKLSELLEKPVEFIDEPSGMKVLKRCNNLKPGEIILLENTRFCDYPDNLESNNDENLSEYWSKLGEVFVVDAFGSLHRNHASVAGISKFLPTYFGLLVKEEIEGLNPVVENINHPFGVFMGGAKIDDKIGYIKNLLPKCDYLMVGGGIANSFLYAAGYNVGDSIRTTDEELLKDLNKLLEDYKDKIILPVDFVFDGTSIMDLGEKSINKYLKYFSECKTIFMNGTCGKFEEPNFKKGTVSMIEGFKNIDAYKVAGGGDTLNAINDNGLKDSLNFLSSGGGASLEYVSEGKLKAIEFIENTQK